MDISQFDFALPAELIAQHPLEKRSASRMLALDRASGVVHHMLFRDFPELLTVGDTMVINDTRVFPARISGGTRHTGGAVEFLLVRRIDNADSAERRWLSLAKPGGKLKAGEQIEYHGAGVIVCENYRGDGAWEISFESAESEEIVLGKYGETPLPPYIARPADNADSERYQTVFADQSKSAAVAAPTAGLHFDNAILERVRARGVNIVTVTLHVGPGTFKPVTATDIEDHTVDPEWAELTTESAEQINATTGKVVAVGTTVTRTLEHAAVLAQSTDSRVKAFSGFVNLYIRPGHEFLAVDELLTNFHLPKSSLLILVSALAGRENILRAYREAVSEKYRFYSYGDCMFIHTRDVG